MSVDSASEPDQSDPLGRALSEYYTRLDLGERVDRADFMKLYPDQAALLQEHWATVDRVEEIVGRAAPVRTPSVRPTHMPCEFAGYKLLEEIGRGGMGVVYRATETATGRPLAIKMILTGHLASRDEVERFRGEAIAAARLRHPGIVPIYHFGQHHGQYYFTMPLVVGQNLADRLADGPLPWREAAEFAATVAEAIEFAHAQGIVHRDLKPANILLDGEGRAVVSDFGLARRLGEESVGVTTTGCVVGTASYMAPEQAWGQLDLVGPTTDVYGLGALLYAMVSGHAPFCPTSLHATLDDVCHTVPTSLRSLSHQVPRDLDTICQKCLEKEPRHRYASAADVAKDLRRLLAGESITARPVGWPERGWRWCRRNTRVAFLLAVAVVFLVFGTLATTYFARQSAARAAQVSMATYAADLRVAQTNIADGWVDRALAVLEKYRTDDQAKDLRGWEWHYLWRQCHAELRRIEGHTGSVNALASSRDGRFLVTGGEDQTTRIWQIATGTLVKNLTGHAAPVDCVCVSPDGGLVASGAHDGTIIVWDTETGHVRHRLSGHTDAVTRLAFTPDGLTLASCSEDATIRVWRASDGQNTQTFLSRATTSLAIDSTGRWIASGERSSDVAIWDLATGRRLTMLQDHTDTVNAVAFSPDGKHIATCAADRTVRIWTTDEWQNVLTIREFRDSPGSVSFSPDGSLLLVSGREQTVEVWDVKSGRMLRTVGAHAGNVTQACFLPDGWRIASASEDGTVRLWAAHREPNRLQTHAPHGAMSAVVFSPDGRWLASAAERNVLLWDAHTGNERRSWFGLGNCYAIAFTRDSRQLAFVDAEGRCHFADVVGGDGLTQVLSRSAPLVAIAGRPDGRQFVVGGNAEEILFVEPPDSATASHALAQSIPHARGVHGLSYSPDGKLVAAGGHNAIVSIVDAASREQLRTLRGHEGSIWDVAFHPKQQLLASAGSDHAVRIWDTRTTQQVRSLTGHAGTVWSAAFSPDGRRLVTCSSDRTVKVWDPTLGLELFSLAGDQSWIRDVAFSPDGQQIAAAGKDGSLYMWDAHGPSTELSNQREAGALVAFLAERTRSRESTLAAIDADQTISEPVREIALQESKDYPYHLIFLHQGREKAERGDFAGAALEFQQAVQLWPWDITHWRWLAISQLAANQHGAYEVTCRAMLERFRETTLDAYLQQLLIVWMAGTHPRQDLESLEAVARRYPIRTPQDAVIVRAFDARLERHVVVTSELEKYGDDTSQVGFYANVFLAMAYLHLGDQPQAETSASKARLLGNSGTAPWDSRALQNALLADMESALAKAPSPPPLEGSKH